jgi:hypothetical protein
MFVVTIIFSEEKLGVGHVETKLSLNPRHNSVKINCLDMKVDGEL